MKTITFQTAMEPAEKAEALKSVLNNVLGELILLLDFKTENREEYGIIEDDLPDKNSWLGFRAAYEAEVLILTNIVNYLQIADGNMPDYWKDAIKLGREP